MSERSGLRKLNAIISAAMMVLFLIHAIGNVLQMSGLGIPLPKALSWTLVGLSCVHAAIGVVLTVDTVRVQRQAGVAYWRQNVRFWVVRASGLALALLICAHALIFIKPAGEFLRLPVFLKPQLVLSLLLVLALAVHVLANVEPLLVSLGVGPTRERAADLMLALAVMLVLMAVGFILYYLRWSVV